MPIPLSHSHQGSPALNCKPHQGRCRRKRWKEGSCRHRGERPWFWKERSRKQFLRFQQKEKIL
jgi:hypothetical protein